jgi:hypothetical protein
VRLALVGLGGCALAIVLAAHGAHRADALELPTSVGTPVDTVTRVVSDAAPTVTHTTRDVIADPVGPVSEVVPTAPDPVAPIVDRVVHAAADTVAPVVGTVAPTIQPVVDTIAPVIDPVVNPPASPPSTPPAAPPVVAPTEQPPSPVSAPHPPVVRALTATVRTATQPMISTTARAGNSLLDRARHVVPSRPHAVAPPLLPANAPAVPTGDAPSPSPGSGHTIPGSLAVLVAAVGGGPGCQTVAVRDARLASSASRVLDRTSRLGAPAPEENVHSIKEKTCERSNSWASCVRAGSRSR